MQQNNKKFIGGFTMLELLVVIAIIAILSGVVLASLSTARERSRDARRQTDIKSIQLAIEVYFSVFNKFPDSTVFDLGVLAPNYIQKIPVDPSTGSNYIYGYDSPSGSPIDFHLGAIFENADNIPEDDADFNSTGFSNGGFDGDSSNCASGGTDQCYDVRP
jgi:prepilin-type N-terminal cleavage/methylation domain-containing protein